MEKGNKESYFGVLGLEKKLSNAKPHRGPSRSSPLAQDPSRNIYCAIQGFIVLFKSTTIFKMKWGERIRKYFMQHLSSRHSCSPKSILPRFRRCLFFFFALQGLPLQDALAMAGEQKNWLSQLL